MLENWKFSIATLNNARRAFLSASLFPRWTFLLQGWWGCCHHLLSLTVDPMICSVPISDVLPRQPVMKKIYAQAATKSTAAFLARRLNTTHTVSAVSGWIWKILLVSAGTSSAELLRAEGSLCINPDNPAHKKMQFSTVLATGTRKGQKTVVLCMGFKYSFLGLLESERAADKSYEVDSCVWCHLGVGEFHPYSVKLLPAPNKVIWPKTLVLCTGSWQFASQLLSLCELCWSAKW